MPSSFRRLGTRRVQEIFLRGKTVAISNDNLSSFTRHRNYGYPCEGQSVERTGSAQAKNLSSRPPSRWNFQASTQSRRAGMKVAVKVACCANARENQAKPKILLFPCAGTCCSSKCLINYRESRTKSFAESIFVSCLAFKIAIVVVQA